MSAGTIWTMIIFGVIYVVAAILVIIAGLVAVKLFKNKAHDRWEPVQFIGVVLAVAAVLTGLMIYCMWPFQHEYHYWIPKSGTVNTVDSRLVSGGEDGSSVQTKFVVSFVEDPTRQQFGVLDTRAAGLKPGDKLTITCKREWQFSGTDGYDCNFVDYQPAKR